jgi:outer membrane protein OmpA-like peptidoglycan-associated protein
VKRLGSILLAALLAACAPMPKPPVLADLEQVRGGATAAEAARYAKDSLAKAEKLHKEAEAAFEKGDNAGAQLLAERALAAYQQAAAVARIARAEAQTTEATEALRKAEAEQAALDADLARAIAEANALELKVKVARDAQPIQPSGKADPEREKARLAAARALAMEGRLLCAAAKLLGPGDEKLRAQVDEAEAALGKVEAALSGPAVPAVPIDGATRARAGCLAALTAVRRASSPTSRAPGAGDALLAAISATGSFSPSRDDRGVAVTLRGIFSGAGAALTAQGEQKLAELGKIAAAHPAFPLEVVIHSDKPAAGRDEEAQRARGEAVQKALEKAAGAKAKIAAVVAGNRAPVADPAGPDKARNARVEIVFVTPESF